MDPSDPTCNYAFQTLTALKTQPGKTVLVVGNEITTAKQMHTKVSNVANLLKWNKIAAGDRILITITPSADLYAAIVAVLALGGTIVIPNAGQGLMMTDACIAAAKPNMWLWKEGSRYSYMKYIMPSLNSIQRKLPVGDLSSPTELLEPSSVVPTPYALITFTTGTTGVPKLVVREHRFLLCQTKSLSLFYEIAVKREVKLEESDAVVCTNLAVFPLHFLTVGATTIFSSIKDCAPAKLLQTLKTHKATAITGSPAFVDKMVAQAEKAKTLLPVLYTCAGGAPIYRSKVRATSAVTPGKKFCVLYGCTEAEPISFIFAEEKMALEASRPRGHCVGKPVFDGTARVIKILEEPRTEPVDIAKDLELPPGETGEIIVSGWHVNTGQVDPKRLITDIDGSVWLKVEDGGYMDSEGRIWLMGRVKWRVERGGKTYWPTDVEQKVLDRCSLITFAVYMSHNDQAWLFLEAPHGLPSTEKAGLVAFLSREGVPVDVMEVKKSIPKDHRHNSKPNTAALFRTPRANSPSQILQLLLKANPMTAILVIIIQLLLIFLVAAFILL